MTQTQKITPENKARLEKWAKKWHERCAAMIDEFTAEDLQLTRASFGENFEHRKPAMDLFMFGAYASICAGVPLAELVGAVTAIADQHAAGTAPHPDDVAADGMGG